MKLHFKSFLVAYLIIFTATSAIGQEKNNAAETYMNSQVKHKNTVLIAKEKQEILSVDIIESQLVVNIGDKYNDVNIVNGYFIKDGKKLTSFKSFSKILSSQDFIDALKKFKLKTEQNGVEFRSLLFALDNESRGKFFEKDGKWIFVRSEFFGDVSGYEITTDKKGRIQSIAFVDKKMELPEKTMGSASNKRFKKVDENYLSKKTKKQLTEELSKMVIVYGFKTEKIEIPDVKLNINIYEGKLEIQEEENGIIHATKYQFVLLEKDGNHSVIKSKSKIMENHLFVDALKEKFSLKNKEDAAEFEKFLDILNPANKEAKDCYMKENIWFFVRNNQAEAAESYMVMTDKAGKIKYMDYFEITDEQILRFKMKDPEFKADFNFVLEQPTKTTLSMKESEEMPVKISFNPDAVNAAGAWIMTRLDGKPAGMSAATTMESPFTDDIPGKYLKKGKHKVEYLLLPPGQSTDNPYGVITLEIEVK